MHAGTATTNETSRLLNPTPSSGQAPAPSSPSASIRSGSSSNNSNARRLRRNFPRISSAIHPHRQSDHDDDVRESCLFRHRKTIILAASTVIVLSLSVLFGEYLLTLGKVDFGALAIHIEKTMQQFQVKGAAVGVLVGGKVVFAKAFGEKDADGNAMETSTLMQIGSTTKVLFSPLRAFTSFAVGTVVQEGLADWDTPVTKLFPDVSFMDPVANEHANLVDLLSHRTIAGNLTGLGWEGLVKTRILEPIGMGSTVLNYRDALKVGDRARGFFARKEGFDEFNASLPLVHLPGVGGAGAVWSTVEDSGDEMDWSYSAERETRKWHRAGESQDFSGLGLPEDFRAFSRAFLVPVLYHNGATIGFTSLIQILPMDDTGVVILTNTEPGTAGLFTESIAKHILDRLTRPVTTTDWTRIYKGKQALILKQLRKRAKDEASRRRNDTVPSLPLSAAYGTYRHEAYGRIRVQPFANATDKESVYMTFDDGSNKGKNATIGVEVRHWELDTFAFVEEPVMPFLENFVVGLRVRFEKVEEGGEGYGKVVLVGFEPVPITYIREDKDNEGLVGAERGGHGGLTILKSILDVHAQQYF
ncbi:hypothetical protein HDU97_006265 [Phlyctochytrium planicorne]|nr:hypothetical protein HDU97_006265 [Phlyctochytrium planicorne]